MPGLYMLALMPPPALTQRIEEERQRFAYTYNCVKALKPPVHITVYPPFKTSEAAIARLSAILAPKVRLWKPFEISLEDYGFFHNPRSPVIYIDVVENAALDRMYRFLRPIVDRLPGVKPAGTAFKGHITIGYRDVPSALFPQIKEAYSERKFKAAFCCSSLFLWQHDGSNWQIQEPFALDGDAEIPGGLGQTLF